MEATDEEWRETFEGNLFQALRMIRSAGPLIISLLESSAVTSPWGRSPGEA